MDVPPAHVMFMSCPASSPPRASTRRPSSPPFHHHRCSFPRAPQNCTTIPIVTVPTYPYSSFQVAPSQFLFSDPSLSQIAACSQTSTRELVPALIPGRHGFAQRACAQAWPLHRRAVGGADQGQANSHHQSHHRRACRYVPPYPPIVEASDSAN